MRALCRQTVFLRFLYIPPVNIFLERCCVRQEIHRGSAHLSCHQAGQKEACPVLDLLFLMLTVAFFAGCLAYIVGCERL
jgi:hypothetical protein